MTLKSKIFKSTIVLALGEGTAYGLSFIRNIILARILTKADFGVAAALAMMISMLEFSSKMAIDRVVVQDQDGDKFKFLATAHFVQFVTSVVSTLCMIFAAGSLANIFGLPNERWAFQVISLTPLFKGFENLDVRRMGRELRFVPSSVVEVVPQFIITLAAWPLSLWVRDYRVVLILLIAKPLLSCIASHILAENFYCWRIEKEFILRIWKFGWPLLANSLLMFGIYQGDRLLVGTYYSIKDLAVYSAASTLTLGPGLLFMQVLGSIMLPVLSRSQDKPEIFRLHYKLCMQLVSAFSVFYAVFLIVGAEPLMVIVFSEKYAGAGFVLAWLAAANAFRFIRTSTVIAAMSKADSKNPMFANFFRLTSLAFAFLAALFNQPIWVLAATGLIGEIMAFLSSLIMLFNRDKIPWVYSIVPACFTASAIAISWVGVIMGIHGLNRFLAVLIAFFIGFLAAILNVWIFKESRQQAFIIMKSFYSSLKRYGLILPMKGLRFHRNW